MIVRSFSQAPITRIGHRIPRRMTTGPVAEWVKPAREASVPELRSAVHDFAERVGASRELLMDLALAVSEAVTNAVIHGFIDRQPGSVRVCVSARVDEIVVVVTDDGRGMQPRPDSPGLGMGLPLIGQLAALLDIREPTGGGTELSMTFVAPGVRGTVLPVTTERLLDDVSRVAAGAWPGEGVSRLVDLLVPAVADACAVDVIDEDGLPQRFAGRIDGPEGEVQSAWLTSLRPRIDSPESATRHVLDDGGVRLAELTPVHVSRITASDEDAEAMLGTGIRWWAVASLRGEGRLLGLLHLGLRPSRGEPAPEWLALLEAVAERAARGLAAAQLVAELDRTRRRFEGILDVLGEAVTVHDAEGRLVYANQAALRLLGVTSRVAALRASPGDLFGRLSATHPDGSPVGREELPGYAAIAGGAPDPMLVRARDPRTGVERWLLFKATVLAGEQRLAVNVIEDVTPGRPAG
jgi:anti-sigma regulatory factor (Ser/Thr protein kinase)/PAS domain-containing protein